MRDEDTRRVRADPSGGSPLRYGLPELSALTGGARWPWRKTSSCSRDGPHLTGCVLGQKEENREGCGGKPIWAEEKAPVITGLPRFLVQPTEGLSNKPSQELKTKSLVMKIARDFVVSGVPRSRVSRLASVGEGPRWVNDETRPFRGASYLSVLRCECWVTQARV